MQNRKTRCARITILSGSPGTGKSTISRLLAENAASDKTVHLEIDDFWQAIRKGYIHPWLDDDGKQNETVSKAAAASALIYAMSGYAVFVAGTIGPWFLKPWIDSIKQGVDVRYIVLRPDEATTVARAAERQQREFFPLTAASIQAVWRSFANLGQYESHVFDSTGQSVDESVAAIQELLFDNQFGL